MAKYFIQEETLTAIGDAIRSKTGGTDNLTPAEMVAEIESIETGGGGSSDVDEMMFLGEDRHDEYMQWGDETPFYSLYKWANYDISNLSSSPVMVSAVNNHETKYMHLYIYAYTTNEDEELYETLVIPPSSEENGWWSTNSLEIEYPCYDVRIWGIRWSDDGV